MTCASAPPKPIAGLVSDAQPGARQRQLGVQGFDVDLRRDASVLQHQNHLDHARNTGGSLQMTDVGLDRPDVAGRVPCPVMRGKLGHLDGIARSSARAMRLQIADLPALQACTF